MIFQEVVIHFECYSLLLLLWNFSNLSRHLFQLLYQNSVNKKITNNFSRRDRNNMVRCSNNGTPSNSHLILSPITAIIESEIFPNISPKCKELNKKVNPFLKRECNGCVHATFSGAGKGEYEVCA